MNKEERSTFWLDRFERFLRNPKNPELQQILSRVRLFTAATFYAELREGVQKWRSGLWRLEEKKNSRQLVSRLINLNVRSANNRF